MARAPKLPQIDTEQRFLAQVAWAYYVEGLTQEKVAEKLGATRLRVNKALSEAHRVGLIRITLATFPRRTPVFLAKVLMVALVIVVAAILAITTIVLAQALGGANKGEFSHGFAPRSCCTRRCASRHRTCPGARIR